MNIALACPACGTGDYVRTVKAVLLDGQSSTASSGEFAGVAGPGLAVGVINQHGRSVTETASLLAEPPPPPPRTSWYAGIVLLAMYCLCWGVVGVATWPDDAAERNEVGPLASFLAPALLALPGLIALVLVIVGRP